MEELALAELGRRIVERDAENTQQDELDIDVLEDVVALELAIDVDLHTVLAIERHKHHVLTLVARRIGERSKPVDELGENGHRFAAAPRLILSQTDTFADSTLTLLRLDLDICA